MVEAKEKDGKPGAGLNVASTVVELLKNIVVLVVVIYVSIEARTAIKTVMGNVQSGKQSLTDVEIGDKSLKLKLTEVHEHLVAALNDAATTTGKGEKPVSNAAKDISAALNATNAALQSVTPGPASPGELWVYLGTRHGAGWRIKNFNLTTDPAAGTSLRASTDVYKRDARPRQTPTPTDPDNLDFGDPVGVLKQGEAVTLLDAMQIRPSGGEVDWWGRIR